MATSKDADAIVKAINANTRAIENLGKAFDKLARVPRPIKIELEPVEHDYDNSADDAARGNVPWQSNNPQ